MKNLRYYIFFGVMYSLSLLPFWIVYRISDILYLLIFYVFKYRRDVVESNLRRAFSDKSGQELKVIEKKFYRYFCDFTLETFKTVTMSPQTALNRCEIIPEALELFKQFKQKNQSVIFVLGHFGNWEWAGASSSSTDTLFLRVIYRPLSSIYFDRLIYYMRTRYGTGLIPMNETYREIAKKSDRATAFCFLADQTPLPENAYWTTFLNQETPIFWGTERISQKWNLPILYVSVIRLRRGYYQMNAEMLIENPNNYKSGEISEIHTRRLEKDILRFPELWLWSHRRWKFKKPDTV